VLTSVSALLDNRESARASARTHTHIMHTMFEKLMHARARTNLDALRSLSLALSHTHAHTHTHTHTQTHTVDMSQDRGLTKESMQKTCRQQLPVPNLN
jgi:tRNA(Leu) C34 or U34 (ribose-2'-O)-methylase TrmL